MFSCVNIRRDFSAPDLPELTTSSSMGSRRCLKLGAPRSAQLERVESWIGLKLSRDLVSKLSQR